MATELSCDLVEEILLRIPAKSLAQLRYTCKQWKTLIEDPRFVKNHLSQNRCREQQFTVLYNYSSKKLSCVGIDFNELDIPSLNLQVSKRWDFGGHVVNIAHCDGLLVYLMSTKLLVVNPLLKQARWVNHDGDGSGDPLSMDVMQDAFGIGYISNQSLSPIYKIVRFRCDRKMIRFGGDKSVRVQVYEFESDSWKDVDNKGFDGFFGVQKSSVCFKGTPYWLGFYTCGVKPDNERFSIQSFDFSKERFEPMSLPPSVVLQDGVSLGIFRGDHLSLFQKHGCTIGIDIWVKQQWSRLMIITAPQLPRYMKIFPHSFIETNGKLVCYGHSKARSSLSIYIVGENQECQKVTHNFNMDSMGAACYYVPSLRQVPGFLE